MYVLDWEIFFLFKCKDIYTKQVDNKETEKVKH